MKAKHQLIGGFFELEVQPKNVSHHSNAIALTNGRACLSLILQHIQPQKVWVPFYTCDALLQPLQQHQIPYEFYAINPALELERSLSLGNDEYLIYINYFGLKMEYIDRLITTYGDRLILDNTQAFFEQGNGKNWAFNSARKFFGVPDGGYLYVPDSHLALRDADYKPNTAIEYQHLVDRMLGKQQQAYQEFVSAEQALSSDVQGMSILAQSLLATVDYESVIQKRRENFGLYHEAFQHLNLLVNGLDITDEVVPFHYPLYLKDTIDRRSLYRHHIFVPTLWQDTLNRGIEGFTFEQEFTQHLLPLPLDHRYGMAEVNAVISALRGILPESL